MLSTLRNSPIKEPAAKRRRSIADSLTSVLTVVPKAKDVEEVYEADDGSTSYVEAVLDERIVAGINQYRICWTGWSLNCQKKEWWLTEDDFVGTDAIDFFHARQQLEKRFAKRLIEKMGASEFRRIYCTYDARTNYKSLGESTNAMQTNRLYLRRKEGQWRELMTRTGEAPVYIMNWTDYPAEITFDMINKLVMSNRFIFELELCSPDTPDDVVAGVTACECKGKCNSKCPCAGYRGTIGLHGSRIKMETVNRHGNEFVACGPKCGCSDECPRKLSQRGRKHAMILFYMPDKGWGLFAAEKIPKGSFMGHYFGELKFDNGETDSDIVSFNEVDVTYHFMVTHDQIARRFIIDATRCGNETRYYNNSCVPNLVQFNIYQSWNPTMHQIGFITNQPVPFGEELTFTYSLIGGSKKGKKCLCRPGCTSRL